MNAPVAETSGRTKSPSSTEAELLTGTQHCQILVQNAPWTQGLGYAVSVGSSTAENFPVWQTAMPMTTFSHMGAGHLVISVPISPDDEHRHLPSPLTIDFLVQAFLKTIDSLLPSEAHHRLRIYQTLMESLRQRIIEIDALALKDDLENPEDINYERHEPAHITTAFLRAMTAVPPSREERFPVYTDEELNRF